jgi:EAL domain-containing protein (putative c-di-GMP-specific phosphodiesterase class I)
MAYEVLGRGLHANLPANPTELLRVAEAAGREIELVQLFRKKAMKIVRETRRELPLLFLNTHPSEIGSHELVGFLRQVRDIDPDTPLDLESHEDALGDPGLLAGPREHLTELGIVLALDDFGLSERFLYLAEVPPDYFNFDISLVKDIVEAPPSKRRLLAMLMAAAKEVNAKPIAEGIEKENEAEVYGTVGFDLAQGYLFSKLLTVEQLEIGGE